MSVEGSATFMPQNYKVFIGHTCIHLDCDDTKKCSEESHELPAQLEKLLQPDAPEDIYIWCKGGPEAFFDKYFPAYRKREAAGGLVLDPLGRLLVILRNGMPDLPKGHLDEGETAESAAIREVSEETGLRNLTIVAQAPDTWHAYLLEGRWQLKHTRWYVMHASANQPLKPQLDEGISDLMWVEPNDIKKVLDGSYRSIKEMLVGFIIAYMK
ncbi:MAG: NUDIX domain-containing protein [Bacteroidetes bacterium]|nr:NUDIX domain-containing protein [Bacteroidota bacterium]